MNARLIAEDGGIAWRLQVVCPARGRTEDAGGLGTKEGVTFPVPQNDARSSSKSFRYSLLFFSMGYLEK
jgi:hypothetical protein